MHPPRTRWLMSLSYSCLLRAVCKVRTLDRGQFPYHGGGQGQRVHQTTRHGDAHAAGHQARSPLVQRQQRRRWW